MRMAALATSVALAAATVSLPALARDPGVSGKPDGHVTIEAHSADVGVGWTWGDGVLKYAGHTYHFTVKGANIAAVGYSKIVGRGRVYNLKHLHDFDGTYAAANGEATAGSGLGGQVLKNGNGVEIRVDDVTKGARLAGGAQGLELTIK